MSQEVVVRSREEDDELQRHTKKVKESHCRGSSSDRGSPTTNGERTSYKEMLIGEVPSAYEQVFHFSNDMETEVESDDESADIAAGVAAVNLSGKMKARIRAPWANALIVKVFGKTVGLDKPLIMLLKIGGIEQIVQYGGINSMCFSCGCVGHKVDGCPYTTRALEEERGKQAIEDNTRQKDSHTPSEESFGPWVLVSRKRQSFRRTKKDPPQPSPPGLDTITKEWPIAQDTNASDTRPTPSGFDEKDGRSFSSGFSHGSAPATNRISSPDVKHQARGSKGR
ncbi:hypothetical protein ACB092_04G176700 [Castanea dentata]